MLNYTELSHITDSEKAAIKEIYEYTLKIFGSVKLRLIGSKMRGDYNENSDVDIVAMYNEQV